jgi:hypothetical protein
MRDGGVKGGGGRWDAAAAFFAEFAVACGGWVARMAA